MDNKKILVLALMGVLLVSGASAISFDTVLDLGCSIGAYLNPSCSVVLWDDIFTGSADDTRHDIYKKGLYHEDSREQYVIESKSRVNQTYGMGLAQAKLAAIEALNNGSSEAKAKEKALEEINDFYSVQLQSVINYQNREVLKLNQTINKINSVSGLSQAAVWSDYCSGDYTDVEWQLDLNATYELYNGSTTTIYKAAMYDAKDSTSSGYGCSKVDSNGAHVWATAIHPYTSTNNDFRDPVTVLDSFSSNTSLMLNPSQYQSTFNKINESHARAQDNAQTMVEEIYSTYSQGELNVSDSLGPLEQLQLASTNYNSTGYYSYAAVSLEQMGIPSNHSYAFDVTFQNPAMSDSKTVTGQLFSTQNFTDGTIETGVNYTVDAGESAWIVYQDGDKATETEITGWYMVNEMTNKKTGEKINTTTLQSTKLYTDGTADLKKQLEQLEDRIADLQNVTGGVGGGITGWFNKLFGGLLPKMSSDVLILLIVVGAAVLYGIGGN